MISRHEERLEIGETRPAAVLFLDVVKFTALSRVLTSEQLTALIDRTFRIFELTVQGQGGYLDKVIGDAALYVFAGHPNYPPVCEGALRAALKLKERCEQVNVSLGDDCPPIAIRIGVAFGDVTRQRVGGQEAQVTVMGETANLAQRLESNAQPGTILTTIRVLDKAGDVFESSLLGDRELKGIGRVNVYQVRSVEAQAVELRGAFSTLTPLIGRRETLEQAAHQIEHWLAVNYDGNSLDIAVAGTRPQGGNRLLVFQGLTAVGKSRLAHELIKLLEQRCGVASAAAHCTVRTSIRNFTFELTKVAGIDADNLPWRWEQLCSCAAEAVSAEYAERQRRHLPLLAYVLGCSAVDTADIAKGDAASFETGCRLALRACCELAAHEAGRPVVLIIEDLQWMQDPARLVVDLISHCRLPQPLIVVATARPEYDHEPGRLGEEEGCVLEVTPLPPSGGNQLIDALLPGLQLPGQLLAELHSKAAGIPYYYEEFARMLVSRELVAEQDGRYVLSSEISELDIPEDIRALILGRLDQLDPELKNLAMRASVLGRSFPYELLAATERQLGFSGENHPRPGLEALTAQRVLVHEPDDRYFFEHLLLREAAYGALLNVNRRLLHNAAATVLDKMYVSGAADEWSVLPGLVRHLQATGRPQDVLLRACQFLMLMTQTGRFEEWDRWEQLATDSWLAMRKDATFLPDEPLCLLIAKATKCWRVGELERSEELFAIALQAALKQQDVLSEARILGGIGAVHGSRGRIEEAREYHGQALKLARECGARAEEARVLGNLGNLWHRQGQFDEAQMAYEEALAISRAVEDSRGEGMELLYLGVLYSQRGDQEQSLLYYDQALELARRVGNRIGESAVLTNLGTLYAGGDEKQLALDYYREALAINMEIGDGYGAGYCLFNMADMSIGRGELAEAEQLLLAARERFAEVQCLDEEGMALSFLGEVYRKQGRLSEAGECLARALEMLERGAGGFWLGLLHCNRARYFLDAGDRAAADAALSEADKIAGRLGLGADSELIKAIGEIRGGQSTSEASN